MLSQKGKLPFKLQVRAAKDFNKNELCLVPFGGSLVDARATAIDKKVVYQSMIHSVP